MITARRQILAFRYRSPEHWIEVFRETYGPVLKTYEALGPSQRDVLTADLLDLIAKFNISSDGDAVIPAEYLEVVIEKR